jgi:hypothetical protein
MTPTAVLRVPIEISRWCDSPNYMRMHQRILVCLASHYFRLSYAVITAGLVRQSRHFTGEVLAGFRG